MAMAMAMATASEGDLLRQARSTRLGKGASVVDEGAL